MKKFALCLLFTISFSAFLSSVHARVKVISEDDKQLTIQLDSKYIMGDADSLIDARRIAMIEAKRMAAEFAGTIIESETVVEDYEVTTDEIRTYAASLIKIETLNEQRKTTAAGAIKYILTIKAIVDKTRIISRIEHMLKDPKERENINVINDEKQSLISKMGKLSRGIKEASKLGDFTSLYALTKQRSDVLNNLTQHLDLIGKDISTLSTKIQKNHAEQLAVLSENKNALIRVERGQKLLKKETSLNPSKELANRGVRWTKKAFLDALMEANVDNVTLFLNGSGPALPLYQSDNKLCAFLKEIDETDALRIIDLLVKKGVNINQKIKGDDNTLLFCSLVYEKPTPLLTAHILEKGAIASNITIEVLSQVYYLPKFSSPKALLNWRISLKNKHKAIQLITKKIKNIEHYERNYKKIFNQCVRKKENESRNKCAKIDERKILKPNKRKSTFNKMMDKCNAMTKHANGINVDFSKALLESSRCQSKAYAYKNAYFEKRVPTIKEKNNCYQYEQKQFITRCNKRGLFENNLEQNNDFIAFLKKQKQAILQ